MMGTLCRQHNGLLVPIGVAVSPGKHGQHTGSLSHTTGSLLLSVETLISALIRTHTFIIMAMAIQNALLSIGLLLPRRPLSDCYHLPPHHSSLPSPHTASVHGVPLSPAPMTQDDRGGVSLVSIRRRCPCSVRSNSPCNNHSSSQSARRCTGCLRREGGGHRAEDQCCL